MRFPTRFLLIALLALPLAACDETGSESGDVEIAIEDALAARLAGRLDDAVEILEGALDREPDNAEVRVELATTLLQRDDLNLLDLERISTFLTTTTGAASPAARRGGCAAANDPTATSFDPTSVANFDELIANLQTLVRADDLLDPVIPDALQGFDICTSVVDGALVYDRAGALAELAAQGLSEAQVAQALAVNALASFIEAYVYLSTEIDQTTTWYRLSNGSITICVTDEAAFEAQARTAIAGLGGAVLSLDARASILGPNSVAAEIVETALDAYETARDGIADFCD